VVERWVMGARLFIGIEVADEVLWPADPAAPAPGCAWLLPAGACIPEEHVVCDEQGAT
jgi:hypothetical protein